MSRRLTAAVVAACLAFTAVGCDAASELAGDARDTVEEGVQTVQWCAEAFRLAQAVADRDLEGTRTAAEALRDDAPEEVQDDVDVVLAAIEDAEAGNAEAIDGQEVREAGQRIRATAEADCDPTS